MLRFPGTATALATEGSIDKAASVIAVSIDWQQPNFPEQITSAGIKII